MDYRLSVALVTRNRPDSLKQTLASLRQQSQQPWEVVISDDSDEPLVAQVKAVAEQFDCRYVVGPRRGLYANRNHVALNCGGTHIRTMDDDHSFPPGHFEQCLAAIHSDPTAIWIIGEYEAKMVDLSEPPIYPGQLHPRGFSASPGDLQDCHAIADGASIYPSIIFARGVRYAEDYKFGIAYLEFGSRLHWLGYRIRTLTTTYIVHHNAGRSFNDHEIHLSAQIFAILCHSFIYQPTIANRTLTSLEIIRQLVQHPRLGKRALKAGLVGFNKQNKLAKKNTRLILTGNKISKETNDLH